MLPGMTAQSPDAQLTLAEAATVLNPPMNERQLIMVVAALNLAPCGVRHTGRDGRPRKTYPAADLMRLHAALLPWLKLA